MLKKSRQIFYRHAAEIKIILPKILSGIFFIESDKTNFNPILGLAFIERNQLESVLKNFGIKKAKKLFCGFSI